MKITVYAHSNKESAREAGAKAGLVGEALHFFSFAANEVKLVMDVNAKTGEAKIIEVNGRRLCENHQTK